MDKLEKRLREDAANIDAEISTELDHRIQASLQGVSPERVQPVAPAAQPYSFWWASSLTGIAAAIAVIAIINIGRPGPEQVNESVANSNVEPLIVPAFQFELKPKAAMLTSPLQQELEALQSDLKKAEQAVREDVDLNL